MHPAKTTSAVAFVIWVVQYNEAIRVTPTHLAMKTTLRIALLCLASLVLSCSRAQQSEALRKQFLEAKAKAEQGDAKAQTDLGVCYYHGQGVEKDFAEAVKWYRKAAEQGVAKAQSNLGVCYANGEGVEKDYAEAVKWVRKAAEQNNANAQSSLGLCYYQGRGVEKDYAEAVKWFRKAAEQNYANAQSNLGFCYANGQGVEKDFAEAYAWYNLASKTDKEAAENRDLLEKKMSPQQVADAQKRTKELRAKIEAQLKSGGK